MMPLANTSVSLGAIHSLPPVAHALPPQVAHGMREPMLETSRLRIRRWERRDVEPFVAMNGDPVVTQFFTGPMPLIQCFQEIERQEVCFDRYQYGIWAVELKESDEFLGCVGLDPTMLRPAGMTARLTWKLQREYWGMNYAYEAAMEVMDYAFSELKVKEVIAIVCPANVRSARLAKRLGLVLHEKTEDCYYKIAP